MGWDASIPSCASFTIKDVVLVVIAVDSCMVMNMAGGEVLD